MTHHMALLRTGGKLHLAPIGDEPQRILDVGTGTGIWAVEMGMSKVFKFVFFGYRDHS
jgi:hypothetical protein